MVDFMNGRKTYAALVIVLLGYLGLADFITDDEVGKLTDSVAQIVGIAIAFYGRYRVKKADAK